MKRLLTTLAILTGLFGSAGAVWADAISDFRKGIDADSAGNKAEAVKWRRKEAVQGLANVRFKLGWIYNKSIGVTQNDAEAVTWYRKAAEQGNAHA